MSNVVQLPYRWSYEADEDYFLRRANWCRQKGWITKPIPIPPISERPQIDAEQPRLPPLFSAAMRRA